MFCTEQDGRWQRAARGLGLGALLALVGCSGPRAPAPPAASTAQPSGSAPSTPSPELPSKAPGQPVPLVLEPPKPVRTAVELRLQAAYRLIVANPDRVYMGEVPEPLLAIPVLEVELFSDGRVKHIHVLRKPGQALDTVQLAIDAVHRAAPFGDVSRMPKPWKFSETFLFNNQRKFKPRTLDQ
ncbi:hypothetical protein OOZ63_25465 [Paucibacter sp. PLA-PC-4]|uniref:hypothetical protein n=1 Tax=Paucibacter sp. PLA-PC-4 TaxID=2993655 RepID=UPI00224A6FBA|nr:hypothetical protein [Paucibacter sp. PLA-PC-4]MCX2865181.1 hypothetical protein [Paucibacter sp. PLA-PC-4]